MQQGRNWHFGEIEFFGGYENIDPDAPPKYANFSIMTLYWD